MQLRKAMVVMIQHRSDKVVDEIAEVQQQDLASQTVQKQVRHVKCRGIAKLRVG